MKVVQRIPVRIRFKTESARVWNACAPACRWSRKSASEANHACLRAAQTITNWKPSHNPWIVAMTVTLATFMEVLDSSIANVSLPHIAGSLGATYEEATWMLTSYLVSSAIVLPVSRLALHRYRAQAFLHDLRGAVHGVLVSCAA